MGVVNTKSTIVTNADATPRVKTDALLAGGRLRSQAATVEVAAGDDDTSVFRMFRVHSSWRIHGLTLLNDAITGGTSYDVGLYDIADADGAVLDADAFAAAVDLSSARVAPLDVANHTLNIDKAENAIWQLAGLSLTSDPNKFYDIALTANTVGSGAGTITMRLAYVDGT